MGTECQFAATPKIRNMKDKKSIGEKSESRVTRIDGRVV